MAERGTHTCKIFIEEGFVSRRVKIEDGKIIQLYVNNPLFSDDQHGLLRCSECGKLWSKWELFKTEQMNDTMKELKIKIGIKNG